MKKMRLMVLLLCAAWTAQGQVQGVMQFPGVAGKNSIVRSINPDACLYYIDDGIGQRYFALFDKTLGPVRMIPVYPNIEIKDMEVHNRVAYFCGQWNGSRGVVGQFDIYNVFTGGDVVYYEPMMGFIGPATGAQVRVTDATKMDVYDDGTDVYIMAVGYGDHQNNGTSEPSCCTMFSAKLDVVSQQWSFCVDYQKGCPYAAFTDIAVSNNYVAVAALDDKNKAYVMEGRLGSPCHFEMYSYSLADDVEDQQLRIEALRGDRFVAAYLQRKKDRVALVDIKMPLSMVSSNTMMKYETQMSSTSSYSTDSWVLKDLRYSEFTDYVLLIGNMSLPPNDVFRDWVLEHRWGIGPVEAFGTPAIGTQKSVDQHLGDDRYVMSGTRASGEFIFGSEGTYTQKSPGCFRNYNVAFYNSLVDMTWAWSNHDDAGIIIPVLIADRPTTVNFDPEWACQ